MLSKTLVVGVSILVLLNRKWSAASLNLRWLSCWFKVMD